MNRFNNLTALSLIVTVLSFFLYLITAVIYYKFNKWVVPSGDPFSYTISLFKLLDQSHNNYWNGIVNGVFNQQWYWLYKLPVALLSPLLDKEPYILCFVNYLFMAVGTISFSRLALRLGLDFNRTLILTLSLWLYPWIYGYRTNFSLFTLMLETSFFWILIAFTSHLIIYVMEPKSFKNAAVAGVFAGLAVWGRGNSLPYILIILFLPMTGIVYRLIKSQSHKKKIAFPLLAFIGISGILASWYYAVTFDQLRAYYWDWAEGTTCDTQEIAPIFNNLETTLAGIKIILLNFPGAIFTRYPAHISSIVSSMVMHLIVVTSLVWAARQWKIKSSRKNRLLLSSSMVGATLYFGNLSMMMFILAPSLGSGEDYSYHPFLMMLVGFAFSMLVPLMTLINIKKVEKAFARSIAVPLAFVFIISYGYYFSKELTPIEISLEAANPNDVSNFAVNLEKIIGNKNLTILWYGQAYNRFILNYYRLQNGIPEAKFYASREEISLLTTSYTSECAENIPIEGFRKLLRKLMLKSDYIMIPENINNFQFMMGQPGLANRREELARFLNSPESPRYGVKMILHDYYGTRLLLLEKLKFGKNPNRLDLLKLPYGSKAHIYPRATRDTYREIIPKNLFSTRMLSSSSTDDFWEVNGIYPHVIQAEIVERKKIVGYSFRAGIYVPEAIDRMPTDWTLEGSNDGEKWIKLDSRSSQNQWEKGGEETFLIQNPDIYTYYRFVFLNGGNKRIIRIHEIKFFEEDIEKKMQAVDPEEYEWEQ